MASTPWWRRWIAAGSRQDGQGLAEYALILVLIALAAIVALGLLGGSIAGFLTDVGNQIDALT